ncbi:hypothetical protein [Thiobaca trueperi]|uniref:hypothetical protein n=1 Tax=Thiobaca trueperi TaxID=127458 RepID=UPI00104F1570|nr:hypothetical protein [Thiobaca trueperi]
MTTLQTRMTALAELENFNVEVLDNNGNVVDPKTNGFAKYDFDRRANRSMTVNEWKNKRFEKTYPGYTCRVLKDDGSEAVGQTRLDNVRATYEEQ